MEFISRLVRNSKPQMVLKNVKFMYMIRFVSFRVISLENIDKKFDIYANFFIFVSFRCCFLKFANLFYRYETDNRI